MTPAQQRYEVSQIFAEAQATGIPQQVAVWLVLAWFDQQKITPPIRILEWLGEVPAEQWRPVTYH